MIPILHHGDSDGRSSAAVVRKYFEEQGQGDELAFFEMDYSKPVPCFGNSEEKERWGSPRR